MDTAIQAAFNAGVIVVISAGNDSCNTANYSLTRIPEAFVVGATDASRLNLGLDARATFSRIGANISVFAPGTAVLLLNFNGTPITANGTSFSAPYMAGMFAVGCQAAGTLCATATNAGVAYTALRNIGLLNTVVDSNGQPLPAPSTPRFISRQPW